MGKRAKVTTKNFDREYLFSCLAMAGYTVSNRTVAQIIGCSESLIPSRMKSGNYTRNEMMKLKKACNMDMYDFVRCFFTDFLREEQSRKYVIRERLFDILTDDFFDK